MQAWDATVVNIRSLTTETRHMHKTPLLPQVAAAQPSAFEDDASVACDALRDLHPQWDGRASILEMQSAASRQWRQMEWFGWYFEFLCFPRLRAAGFSVPGERFGRTTFDVKRCINWDLKAHALHSNTSLAVLNDLAATSASIATHGAHGLIIALCDVEYDDEAREFQLWHSTLKGGLSAYEKRRIKRTSRSRRRKTHASLSEILFVELTADREGSLKIMHQGKNSNGRARPTKFVLDRRGLPAGSFASLKFSKP